MTTTKATELDALKSRLMGRLTAIRNDRVYVELTRAKFGTAPKVEMIADALDRVEATTAALLTALEGLTEGEAADDAGP